MRLQALPDSTSPSTSGPAVAQSLSDAGPVADVDEYLALIEPHKADLIQFGSASDPRPHADPTRQHYYAVDSDSTVWLQDPAGGMVVVDAYPFWSIGSTLGERFAFEEAERSLTHAGYGYEDGRLYLYLTQSAPVIAVGVVLLLLAAAVAVGVRKLWVGLRRAEEQNQLLMDSRRRLADSREAERMRLARDLHDGPLQDLQAMRMRLGMSIRDAGRRQGPAPDPGELEANVREDLERVAVDLRSISEGLRPPVLDSFGLSAALRSLADRLRDVYPAVRLDLELADDDAPLPDGVGITLYRIAQEGLANAMRHGRPSHVTVRYARDADGTDLTIEDDGVGFEVPDDRLLLERNGHLGVTGMVERTESFGGQLDLVSRPGLTRLSARLPIPS